MRLLRNAGNPVIARLLTIACPVSSAIKTRRDLNGSLLLFQNPECILFVIDESVLTHGGELAGQGASVGANVICQFDASQRERDVTAVLLLGLH